MSTPKVSVIYANGGLLQSITALDGVAGLVGTGNTMLGQHKIVHSLVEAEELGFTEEDEPVAYRHIKEFYQEYGGNTELHVMLVPSSMTMEDMLDNTNENGAKKLIRSAEGRIRLLAVFRSPDPLYDPGANLIDDDVEAALLKAKAFAIARVADLAPVRILIEGRVANPEVLATATYTVTVAGVNGNVVTLKADDVVLGSYTVVTSDTEAMVAAGLRAAINLLTSSHGFKASGTGAIVVITAPTGTGSAGNDLVLTFDNVGAVDGTITNFAGGSNMVANTLQPSTLSNGYAGVVLGGSLPDGSASIGTLLGRACAYGAHIKIGKVSNGPLSLSECYIGRQKIKDVTSLDALHGAGFISFMKHPGKGGFFFGIDRMASTDDYRLLAYGRVVDKAAIIAAAVYIEELESEITVGADGKLDPLAVAALTDTIRMTINNSMGEQISGLQIIIDPAQDVINTAKLVVRLRIIPKGYTTFIEIDLGLMAPSV